MNDEQVSAWRPTAIRIAWGLVAAGVALRLIRYLANRSLWLDEAYLAESILTYSFRQLATDPLLHWQAAPIGFLFLQKLAVTVFGTSEYALRVTPLLAGLASVPLFAAIARRCLPPAGGLVALVMAAALEPLVYYSAEVKQYALDVAFAMGIVLCSFRLLEATSSVGRLVTLGVVGAAAIFFSHPSVFILAAATMLSLRRVPGRITAVAVVWLALFVVNYVLFLRPLSRHGGLAAYWAAGYMPWDVTAIPWLGRTLYAVFTDYGSMWLPLPHIAIGTAALGLAWTWSENRRAFALCTLSILFTLAAAALHRYPFSGRLILFLVPFVILLMGGGVQAVLGLRMTARQVLAGLLIAAVIGPTVGLALYYVVRPGKREEMKSVLAHVRGRRQSGDVLYVWNVSQVPFRYYRDRLGLGDMPYVAGEPIHPTADAYAREFERLRGRGRVWVLLTHWAALGGPDERGIMLPVLDRLGARLEAYEAKGAMVILYDLPPAGATATGSPPR